MSTFDALIIDPANVFYDVAQWRRWLYSLLRSQGVNESAERFLHRLNESLNDVHRGRSELKPALCRFLESAGLAPLQVTELVNACLCQRKKLLELGRPLLGTLELLTSLKALGIPVVLSLDSSWDSTAWRQRLESWRVNDYVTAIVCSCETGVVKPDTEAYLAALAKVPQASRVAFLAQDPTHLLAARMHGLQTIGLGQRSAVAADYVLMGLSEVAELAQRSSESCRRAA